MLRIDPRGFHDGSLVVPGWFPVHDLADLGIEAPLGDQTTVAGMVLRRLGRIPQTKGDIVNAGEWELEVTGVAGRRVTEVVIRPASDEANATS